TVWSFGDLRRSVCTATVTSCEKLICLKRTCRSGVPQPIPPKRPGWRSRPSPKLSWHRVPSVPPHQPSSVFTNCDISAACVSGFIYPQQEYFQKRRAVGQQTKKGPRQARPELVAPPALRCHLPGWREESVSDWRVTADYRDSLSRRKN